MELRTTPQGVVAGSIPLFAGHPAHDLLPIADVREIVDAIWAKPDATRLFNYGGEQGNAQLIEFLASRLRSSESLPVSSENIMIIGGSTWGVDMVTHHLTDAGNTILVDAPSYRDALHIFRDQGLKVREIPVDQGGIVVDEMARQLRFLANRGQLPKFYYVVPNFQNPTGITISQCRRQAIIELSQEYGFAIVEDDVYRDIRFVDQLPPSFYALAESHDVLRLGTFSKTLAPGLRIGWLMASASTVGKFVGSGKLRMGGGANPFTAAVVAEYCQSGRWEGHVAWLRRQYRERRDVALSALKAAMPASTSWTRPEGGYFIWLRLPDSVPVDALEAAANRQNVYFAPGKDFYVDQDRGRQHLRLSFSYVSLEDMRTGITTLGHLIKQLAAG